mmetsp:Transcript_54206/g.89730  ORF Transcript_54206/g.89730 Transcript_54206/m.89730 type:complete len:362 (-) Transcript_54206:488-1573(-)
MLSLPALKRTAFLQPLCNLQRHHFSDSAQKARALPQRVFEGPNLRPSIVIQNHHIDSTRWYDFEQHPSDIYVNTPAKAGTTWTQEIVGQLLYNGDIPKHANTESIHDISPWLALSVTPKQAVLGMLQQQLEKKNIARRMIKTHEPVEAMPFHPECKYIVVARDFRDVVWSIYNHYSQFTDEAYAAINSQDKGYSRSFKPMPKFNFEDGSFTEYDLFKMMLTEPDDDGNPDGGPWWSQLWVIGSWWKIRDLPNVKLVHYANLKEDLAGSVRSIAEFCEIPIDEERFDYIVSLCTFESMKARSVSPIPKDAPFFKDRSKFMNKGQTGRWQTVLSDEDTEKYRTVARRYLDDEGIRWLETGKLN